MICFFRTAIKISAWDAAICKLHLNFNCYFCLYFEQILQVEQFLCKQKTLYVSIFFHDIQSTIVKYISHFIIATSWQYVFLALNAFVTYSWESL